MSPQRSLVRHWLKTTKLREINSQNIYLVIISLLGLLFVGWGLVLFPTYDPKLNFFLLAILAAAAQIATTSVSVSDKAGITFEVGTAVTVAAIPFYGPGAATVIVAFSTFSLWLIKSHDKTTWKKSWRQLSFNTGMLSIAMFVAGTIFKTLETLLGTDTLLGLIVPWFVAAILYDQLNLWLLIIMLRLQNGDRVNPLEIWRENLWAATINILVISVGGGFLAFATKQYDWIGIIVFFLPIVLSAYAFRLYVRQMQAHMDNLETIVAERTEKLERVMKEKDAFLAVLSHDMKTPLTIISLYASMIRSYPHVAVEKPHLLETIIQSQKALTDIVNNILDLEKLQEGGSMPLEKETVDLASLIETTVEPLKAQAAQKQIELHYEINTRPLLVDADRGQIKRVIQNLVSNAIKYTPQEGHISVHAYVNDRVIVTQVQDNGYGIPDEEMPYVFDRFRRVAKHKNVAAGTGLGLAITKAIVEAHEGTISATSEENRGSTFTFELPV